MIDNFILVHGGTWINASKIISFFINDKDVVVHFEGNLKFLYKTLENNEQAIKCLNDRMRGIVPWNAEV